MPEKYSWSIGIGRWLGVPVRIHLILIILCVAALALEVNLLLAGYQIDSGTAIVTILVLFCSLAVHELGHWVVLNLFGRQPETVVLMPWGGISGIDVDLPTKSRIAVNLAGPLMNGVVFSMAALFLTSSGHLAVQEIINPFRPFEFDSSGKYISLMMIVAWVNFQLMIVNFLPSFPFDGGAILRSIAHHLGRGDTNIRIEATVMFIGFATGFALIGISFFLRDMGLGPVNLGWIGLLLAGIILCFCARASFYHNISLHHSDRDSEAMEMASILAAAEGLESRLMDDFSDYEDFDFSDKDENLIYSRWLQEKQEERHQELLDKEAEEDQQADEILGKLHHHGFESLTSKEREILDRVSARMRRRRQQGVQ